MNPPATATAASLVRAPLLLRLFACKLQEFFVFGASQNLLNKFQHFLLFGQPYICIYIANMQISKIKAWNPKTLESCAFLRFSIAIFFDQNFMFLKIAMFSIHGFKQVARNYRRIVFFKKHFCHKPMCFLVFFNSQ